MFTRPDTRNTECDFTIRLRGKLTFWNDKLKQISEENFHLWNIDLI